MQDSVALAQFSDYLKNERKSSDNTISSYMRDMRQLSEYLDEHNMPNLLDAGEKELGLYVDWLRHIGKSRLLYHAALPHSSAFTSISSQSAR